MPYTDRELRSAMLDRIAQDPNLATLDFATLGVSVTDKQLSLEIMVNFEGSFTFTTLRTRLDTEHASIYESTAHWSREDRTPPLGTFGWSQYAVTKLNTLEQAVQELYTLLSLRIEAIVASLTEDDNDPELMQRWLADAL